MGKAYEKVDVECVSSDEGLEGGAVVTCNGTIIVCKNDLLTRRGGP